MKKIQYELKDAVMYSPDNRGEEIEGSFIEISEPTGNIAHLVSIIKVEMAQASKKALVGIDLSGITESDLPDKNDESDGTGELEILMLGGADMGKVIITFKEILRETALMAGEKKFTEPMFKRMSYNDVEGCLAAYIGNFISQ